MNRGAAVRPAFATASTPTSRRSGGRARREPVTTLTVPAAVMRAALALAGYDASRLVVQRDGSVIVRNRPPAPPRA